MPWPRTPLAHSAAHNQAPVRKHPLQPLSLPLRRPDMNTTGFGSQDFNVLLHRLGLRRGLAFGTLIVAALLAFEIFNYSTTEFALTDLLGGLEFAGLRWATI